MQLVTMVYFSNARRKFSHQELVELLKKSRVNNQRKDITGMLLYHDGNFVQALEGPVEAVEGAFAHISTDPRHGDIIATSVTPIEARQFPDWTMGFLSGDDIPQEAREALTSFLKTRGTAEGRDGIGWRMLKTFRDNSMRAA